MSVSPRPCDVVVIGAGPAGIAAAEALVAGGARVALLDKSSKPGGKTCGGGLTASSFERAQVDAARPPRFARRFDALEVRSPLGRYRAEHEGPLIVVIDRSAWQAERIAALADAGCDVLLGTRVLGVSDGLVATDGGVISCGRIVGADGAASRVRRLLGLATDCRTRAFQTVLEPADAPGAPADLPAVWFCVPGVGAGYAWSFPAVDGALRLGIGADARTVSGEGLRRAFETWIGSLGGRPRDVRGASIACGYAGHRFGRVYLAGDAAGLASPLTGEGIAQALESGTEVAREILDASYRSVGIARLVARHRRTRDVVETKLLGGALFALAPLLLRLGPVRSVAFRRYA